MWKRDRDRERERERERETKRRRDGWMKGGEGKEGDMHTREHTLPHTVAYIGGVLVQALHDEILERFAEVPLHLRWRVAGDAEESQGQRKRERERDEEKARWMDEGRGREGRRHTHARKHTPTLWHIRQRGLCSSTA